MALSPQTMAFLASFGKVVALVLPFFSFLVLSWKYRTIKTGSRGDYFFPLAYFLLAFHLLTWDVLPFFSHASLGSALSTGENTLPFILSSAAFLAAGTLVYFQLSGLQGRLFLDDLTTRDFLAMASISTVLLLTFFSNLGIRPPASALVVSFQTAAWFAAAICYALQVDFYRKFKIRNGLLPLVGASAAALNSIMFALSVERFFQPPVALPLDFLHARVFFLGFLFVGALLSSYPSFLLLKGLFAQPFNKPGISKDVHIRFVNEFVSTNFRIFGDVTYKVLGEAIYSFEEKAHKKGFSLDKPLSLSEDEGKLLVHEVVCAFSSLAEGAALQTASAIMESSQEFSENKGISETVRLLSSRQEKREAPAG